MSKISEIKEKYNEIHNLLNGQISSLMAKYAYKGQWVLENELKSDRYSTSYKAAVLHGGTYLLHIASDGACITGAYFLENPKDLEIMVRCFTAHQSATKADYWRLLALHNEVHVASYDTLHEKKIYETLAAMGDYDAMAHCMGYCRSLRAEYELYKQYVKAGHEEEVMKRLDLYHKSHIEIVKRAVEGDFYQLAYETCGGHTGYSALALVKYMLDNNKPINYVRFSNSLCTYLCNHYRCYGGEVRYDKTERDIFLQLGDENAALARENQFKPEYFHKALFFYLLKARENNLVGLEYALQLYYDKADMVGLELGTDRVQYNSLVAAAESVNKYACDIDIPVRSIKAAV